MNVMLFDPGLQPERTRLAWRRTTLALTLGSAAALRILPHQLGAGAFVLGVAGLASSAAVGVLAHRRTTRVHQALAPGASLPGAHALALLATVASGAGVFVIVGLLVNAL